MADFYSSVSREKKENIYEYLKKKMLNDKTLKLYIAVDSKKRKMKTCYVVAAVLYSPTLKKGAEIWFKKYNEKSPPDLFTRLWKEVELIVEWAPKFYHELQDIIGDPKNMNVHLDLNPDPKWRSYKVYKAGYSWVKSLGFKVESKPLSWACRAADYLT